MTFEEICALEPRVKALAEQAQSIKDDGSGASFCATGVWTSEFKLLLAQLVGVNASKKELASAEAVEVATQAIRGLLPPCRNCGCP